MIISVFLDVLSIGSLIPIFNELTNVGQAGVYNRYLEKFTSIFKFEYSIILFSILTFILFSLKNLFIFFYIKISSNFFSYLTIYHQEKILQNYLNSPFIFFSKKTSSFFLREILDEIKQLNSFYIQPIMAIILNILTILFFTIFLFNINFLYTSVLISFSIIFYFIFAFTYKNKIEFFGEQRRIMNYKMVDNVKQMFEGFRELKIYNKKNLFIMDLKKRFNRMANVNVARSLISNIPKLFLEVILVFMFLIIILYNNDNNSEQHFATIGVFTASAFRIMPNIISLIRSYQRMNYSETALQNILPVLDKNTFDQKANYSENLKFEKNLELKGIDFFYEKEKEIFKDLNIIIDKNSCIGIKGESGSGKSTLVDILCGFLDINKGKILIDNEEKKIYESQSWLDKISYIQQSVYIFDSSIFTNISLEKEIEKIDKDLVNKILHQLNMIEFNNNDKISLGELGSKISGGQAQRIGIARALYRESEILIFDESFNSLDQKNHKIILDLINKLKKNKTIIIISHNDKDFLPCDKIYEIRNHKIIKQD